MTTLTTDEAALRCNVARPTIHSWIQRGKLVATKQGRDYLIEVADLDKCNATRKAAKRGANKSPGSHNR